MNYLKTNELFDLVSETQGLHVSIFMPRENEPDKAEINRIRLKNLIKEGRNKLSEEGIFPSGSSKPDIEQFFKGIDKFVESLNWQDVDGRGLALFLDESNQYIYPSPIPFEEGVFVEPRFNIRPLLPLMTDQNEYFLLTLSQEKVHLWKGNQMNLEKIEVPQLPEGMAEALALEDPERSLQSHVSTGKVSDVQRGERAAIHHGHEAEKEKKGAILRYFRVVDEAIMIGLADEKAPLVLAAVEYLMPIYREANNYPHLLDEGVTGNPDHVDTKTLHKKALETAEPYFNQAREEAIKQFEEIKGTEISSQDMEDIVPAAANGRVATLLVQKDRSNGMTGFLNRESNSVERCQESSFECGDLLNLAAIKTIQNSGDVYALDAEEMPSESEVAAIFRYAI